MSNVQIDSSNLKFCHPTSD